MFQVLSNFEHFQVPFFILCVVFKAKLKSISSSVCDDHAKTICLPAGLFDAIEIKVFAILYILGGPEQQSAIPNDCSSASHAVKLVYKFDLAVELALGELLEHLLFVEVLRLLLLLEKCADLTQLLEDSWPQTQIHLIVKLGLDLN